MKSQADGTRPSSRAKRRAVVAAAERAFLDAGYAGVTMDAIAEAAHVSKQTVYAYVGTKEQLFVELVTEMTRAAGDQVMNDATVPDDRGEVEQSLTRILELQLSLVLSPRLVRLRRLVIAEADRFPDLARAVYEQGPQRAVTTLENHLRELDARGWLLVPDPAAAAEQLNWLVMGAPTNAVMFLGDQAALPPQDRRGHVARAVRTFLAAHRPPA